MVRRAPIFALLGPFLIWLQFIILQVPDLIRKPDSSVLPFFSLVLVIVIALGIVPGIVLAGVDQLMADRRLSRVMRAVACGALGYPLTLLAGWWIGLSNVGLRSIDDNFYVGGLFGVIAAAVCSWLAGRQSKVPK
jgi:hypothetical protein